MVHNAGARQVFRKYGHPQIFSKRGTTHNPAVKWSLKKLGTYCGFFMAVTLTAECPKKVHKFKIIYLYSGNRQITNFCVIC